MAIVKMKHLRLAAMQSDREALLRLLQGMGCLEIEEPSVDWSDPEWAGLKSPDSGALSAAREEKNAAQHALEVLKRYAKVKGGLLSPRPVVSPQQFFEEQAYRSALETARAINDGERELAALKAERDKQAAQRASLAPWIPLELPLDTASTREVEVQFGTVSAETPFPQLAGEVQAVSELAQLTLASADRENQYLLLICHRSALDEVLEKLKEGQILTGTVVSIKEFGAFVEFAPGKEGMVHISKIAKERIDRVEDVLTLGDQVTVVCLGKDKMGRMSFSMKDVAQV